MELDEAPFYLESEFVEGGNLRDWGGTDGRLASLPLEERLRLVAEIGGAVAAAHSVGIIHKDLKPSNVFMRQAADGRWHPMLADFGIGAVADRSQLEQRGITVAGFTQSLLESGSSRTGTRMYQPPEANLARPATVQGDVYALGVLLFQMIVGDFDQPLGHGWERRLDAARGTGFQRVSEKATGKMPVPRTQEGEASSEPLRQMVATPSAPGTGPLRALDPTGELVVRLLRDDIGDCVDGDPGARLASAAQLVERLQGMDKRVADGLARRRAERAAVRMRRLRAALAASVAALIVVGGLGVFAFAQWRRAEVLKKAADEAHKAAVDNEKRAVDNEKKARANAEAASQQSQLALDTLNAVIFDIQGSVENLSGSSRIRQRLLGTALKRLEQLSGEFVQRSTADRHTAIALLKMGDLVLQFGEAPRSGTARGAAGPGGGESRGAAESARRFYTRSMEIFQALAQADPNDAQAKRDLSISYDRLGDVHLQAGCDRQGDAGLPEVPGAERGAGPGRPQRRPGPARPLSVLLQDGAGPRACQRPRPSTGVGREDARRRQATERADAPECRRAARGGGRLRNPEPNLRPSQGLAGRRELRTGGAGPRAGGARARRSNPSFRWDFSITLRIPGERPDGRRPIERGPTEPRGGGQGRAAVRPAACSSVAWLLATSWDDSIRDGKKAIELATKACELTEWKNPDFLDTLAAAYAEAGQFDDAVKWQKKALEHPEAFDAAEFEQAKQRLKLYEARQPYHVPRPALPGPASSDRPASR